MNKFFKASAISLCFITLWGCVSLPKTGLKMPHQSLDSTREVAMKAYVEGDYHLAEGLLQELAEAPHLDPQAPCFLGAIHYRQHAYKAALRRFDECRQSYPEHLEVWFNAAATHMRLATELLLTGRSYQADPVTEPSLGSHYEELLEALLKLQRVHMSEVR